MATTFSDDLNIIANSNIEIALLDGDLSIIQKLDDEPNDVGGLTAAQLKAKFDEAGLAIQSYINETLIPAVVGDGLTEQARQNAETARVTAEDARASAESARVTAEEQRVTTENNRVSAETTRANAETSRVNAETSRANAESARSAAETSRVNAESARVNAESARADAETSRADAETARVNAENARNAFELYNSAKTYVKGNKVSYNGSSYVCTAQSVTNVSPTDTGKWLVIAAKGDTGEQGIQGNVGPQGPQGIQGLQGPQGIAGAAVQISGYAAFNVDESGHLICTYTGDEQPDFSINSDGHLILTL